MRAEHLAWLTGENAPEPTGPRWAVDGTDLGIMWDDGAGGVLAAFGDTFNPRQPEGGGGGGDWRSNVIARTATRDLSGGLPWDWFAVDRPGHAREILRSRKIDRVEKTVIPTGGCSVGGRQYLAYMSVREWGEPGEWSTSHAGIAWSDDGGATWTKSSRWLPWRRGPVWPAGTGWGWHRQMTALVHHHGHVYLFSSSAGRSGSVILSRAPAETLLKPSTHRHWDGDGWVDDEWIGVPVMPAPVGELSVAYHRGSGRWLATHYRDGGIVVRTASEVTGPWSGPEIVATAKDYPGLYGAFLHPWSMDDPDTAYFAMSQWGPYAVRMMRLTGLGNL